MLIYYTIVFFIIGTVLTSFYNVVGYRLPKGESIIYPPSHCPKCNHKLRPLELIPILSFVIQKGRCKNCNQKISWFYPIFELAGGILFALAYLSFGMSLDLIIALTFISMALIIIVSDYHYLIIPDEVIITFVILFILEIVLIRGFHALLYSILSAFIAFSVMFLLKKLGDFLFKKESMGGGDIKLMFIFGLLFGYPLALFSIFLGALIGLPISILIMIKKSTHIVPFGPFLCLAGIMILLTGIDNGAIIYLLTNGI